MEPGRLICVRKYQGDFTGWSRAAAIAGAAGIPVSTHLYPEVAAHVMRVTETAHWLEWQDWANPILLKPYDIKDGLLHIPIVPGVGLEWNEDIEFRITGAGCVSQIDKYLRRTKAISRYGGSDHL